MAGTGRGWNPATGWDNGGLPPGSSMGGSPNIQTHSSAYGSAPNPMSNPYTYPNPSYMPGPPSSVGVVYTTPANGFQHPVPVIPGQPGGPRYPGPHPVVNPECPAINLQNSTGGMGCEPGYNYYFPAEHTKVHVIKSRDPPWRLPGGVNLQFAAYHVPVQTTLGDLMKGFGATNSTAKKNKITEVVEGGSSRWYKGVTFSAHEKDDMKKTLKDLGWDANRTGRMREKPVVWLWVTKD